MDQLLGSFINEQLKICCSNVREEHFCYVSQTASWVRRNLLHSVLLSSFQCLLNFLGGITIAWVNEGNDGNPCVLHIQPFTAKDFATRSLSDRIRDFDDLTILFPNKAKNEAFDKYTTPTGQVKNKDYIPSEIRAILSTSNNSQNIGYANTPASYMQSPDPSRDTPSVQSG